jgi:hypothetical protein
VWALGDGLLAGAGAVVMRGAPYDAESERSAVIVIVTVLVLVMVMRTTHEEKEEEEVGGELELDLAPKWRFSLAVEAPHPPHFPIQITCNTDVQCHSEQTTHSKNPP